MPKRLDVCCAFLCGPVVGCMMSDTFLTGDSSNLPSRSPTIGQNRDG